MNPAPSTTTMRRLKDGFLERGTHVTRLEAFVDAAFAFSVTLLVVSLDAIPDSIPALIDAMKGVPAFALSFLQIAMFWHAHATWSRRYGLDDATSTALSLFLVFLVLVYVYPLKLLFGSFFSWITRGWIPSPVVFSGMPDLILMFVIYGTAFATLSVCLMALYAHAWRQRAAIGLSNTEAAITYGHVAAWGWGVGVALLSIVVAWALPEDPPGWATGAPGLVYFLMNLTFPVSRYFQRRAQAQLARA